MILQQYYTSSPRGLSGNAGFGIKAESSGLEPAVSQVLAYNAEYHHPHGISQQDTEAMPLSLSFYSLGEGLWGITHTKYVGQDYSGRWGNYFSHSLVLTGDGLEAIQSAPIGLVGAELWATDDPGEPRALPPLDALAVPPLPAPPTVAAFIRDRREHAGLILEALIEHRQQGRRLVIADEPANSLLWLQSLTSALPTRLRPQLTFSTYQCDPRRLAHALTCTTLDGDFRFSANEYQMEFFVFNLLEGKCSEGITVGPAAQLLADALAAGDADTLANVNYIADSLQVTDLTQLNGVAAVQRVQLLGLPNTTVDDVAAMCGFLAAATPDGVPYALEVARSFSRTAMDHGLAEHLAVLLRTYRGLCPPDAVELFEDDCRTYLAEQLRGPNAMAAFGLFMVTLSDITELPALVARQTGKDDWIAFLNNADPDEAGMARAAGFVNRAAAEALRVGDLSVWNAYARWAARHGSALYFRSLLDTAQAAAAPDLATLRTLVDIGPASGDEGLSQARFGVCLLLLLRGLQARDGAWEDDCLRCTDALSAGQAPGGLQALIHTVSRYATVIVFACEALLTDGTASVADLADALTSDGGVALAEVTAHSAGRFTMAPVVAEVLARLAAGGQMSAYLGWLSSRDWQGVPPADVEKLVAQAVAASIPHIRSVADVDAFMGAMQGIERFREAYGLLLLQKAERSPELLIVATPGALEALHLALDDDDEGAHPRASVSERASVATWALGEHRRAWEAKLQEIDVARVPRLDAVLYRQYVTHVLRTFVETPGLLSPRHLADLTRVLLCRHDPAHLFTCVRDIIKATTRRAEDRYVYVDGLVEALLRGDTRHLTADTADAAATVLRLLDDGQLELLHSAISGRHRPNTASGKWWADCYARATSSWLSRVIGRRTR